MEKYEELEMEVIEFEKDDVIATSPAAFEVGGQGAQGPLPGPGTDPVIPD